MIWGTFCPPRDSDIVPYFNKGLLPRRLPDAPFLPGPTLSGFFESDSILPHDARGGSVHRWFANSAVRASEHPGAVADAAEPHADQSRACRASAQWHGAGGLRIG